MRMGTRKVHRSLLNGVGWGMGGEVVGVSVGETTVSSMDWFGCGSVGWGTAVSSVEIDMIGATKVGLGEGESVAVANVTSAMGLELFS